MRPDGTITVATEASVERSCAHLRALHNVLGAALSSIRLAGPPGLVAAIGDALANSEIAALLANRPLPPARWTGFLPAGATPIAIDVARLAGAARAILPWPLATELPRTSCREPTERIEGWITTAPVDASSAALPLPALVDVLERQDIRIDWLSAELPSPMPGPDPRFETGQLSAASSVLAVIPHLRCEAWLDQALRSLRHQTRAPDAIVVVDDASGAPPRDICAAHPGVSLYETASSAGPYRIVQSVIEATSFDAYLFQDADDFSAIDRLERLLAGAAASGAELVGTQEIRILADSSHQPATYPLDVNKASDDGPQHPLLHPTSLVARSLVQRLGGFATGLRFSGDTEFLYRAVFAARIANIPSFGFMHRIRPASLTTNPETGMESPARKAILGAVRARAAENLARTRAAEMPDLAPLAVAPPVGIRHVAGPRILGKGT